MLFIIIGLIFIVTLYFYSTRNFNYWKKRGVKYEEPLPLVGNYGKIYLLQRNMAQLVGEIYHKHPNEKLVGMFRANYPELIIKDPDLIKRVLITDFSHFHLRKLIPNERDTHNSEPLLSNLVNINGDLWRLLRQRLTPAFSSGKLKAMFPLIVERAERLHTLIQDSVGKPIDARDLMARFTTDIIGACGFGLEMDALTDEESEFRKLGRKILNISPMDAIKLLLKQLSPNLFKNYKFTDRFANDMLSLVKSVLTQRNYMPSGRNDFVDLLLECKQKGTMIGDSMERFKPDGTPEKVSFEMTDDLIAAQMSVFFTAGFETSSSTSSFTLHQLAYNPDKQKKVHEEIDRVLSKYDHKLCYDAIKEMHYLEWAFKESMRRFPAVGVLIRDCAHKYTFPGTNVTIDEGIRIYVPVMTMQNDPNYFKDPEQFRPERFSPDELDVGKTKFAYLPFGDGPRNCIGERLGIMQAMAGLAAVLSKFTVETCPATVEYPIYQPRPTLIQTIKGGLYLVFRERKKEL